MVNYYFVIHKLHRTIIAKTISTAIIIRSLTTIICLFGLHKILVDKESVEFSFFIDFSNNLKYRGCNQEVKKCPLRFYKNNHNKICYAQKGDMHIAYCSFLAIRLFSDRQNTSSYHRTISSTTRVSIYLEVKCNVADLIGNLFRHLNILSYIIPC